MSPDLSRTILSNLSGVSVDAHGEPQVENWDRFERTAHEERVAPLLHLALRQPDLFRSIPDDVRRSLRRSYWSTAARNVSLLGALDELGEKLESLGVLPVVLKGAVLAQEVYPSLALRPMDDVDLLVREDELPGTEAALSSLGFRVWAPEIAPGLTRSTKHARLYVNDRTAELAVDLHWSLVASENDRRSPPLSVFWQGVRRSASVGLRLSDTLHFLYLIGHLMLQHHNGRRRLLWWVDLHLMTRRGTIDWHEVRCRAGDFGWADTVGAALEELELRFPGSVPSDGRRAVMNDVTARSAPPRVQGERGFAELATLGWRGRLRLVVAHLFPAPGYVRHRYRLRSRWSWPLLYPVRWSTIAAKSAAWLVRAARGGVRRLMTEADTISTSS